MKFHTINRAARVLFILCMPLFVFSLVLGAAFNYVPLYEYGFREYDAGSRLGISEADLTGIAKELISYYVSGDEYLDIRIAIEGKVQDLFNREELIHMKDVKGLVQLDYRILLGTFLYILAYTVIRLRWTADRRALARSFLAGSLLTLSIMLALYLGSLWDFDWLFYRFHLIAFSNEHWSAQGYMLKLFPGGFWYDATLFCSLAMVLVSAVIGGISGGWLYRTGKGLHFQRLMS